MNRRRTTHAVPVGLAATALVLAACSADSTAGDASPTAAGHTTRTISSPTPTAEEGARALSGTGEVRVPAGRYSLRLTPTLAYEVDLPGPRYVDGGLYVHHPDAPGVFAVTSAPADGTLLPRHPCTDKSEFVAGPTPEALARDLADQPLLDVRNRTRVTLHGAHGVYLEVRVPPGVDTTRCQDVGDTTEEVELFRTEGGERWSWAEGYVGRWWILDVDGERVVVMNHCDLGCTPRDRAVLRRMAESVTFTPGQ